MSGIAKIYLVLEDKHGEGGCIVAASLRADVAYRLMEDYLKGTKEVWRDYGNTEGRRQYPPERWDATVEVGPDGIVFAYSCLSKLNDGTTSGWNVTMLERELDI